MASNLPGILNAINTIIRSQTTIDSITPTDVAYCLDLIARYAGSAYPIPFFTDDDGNISDSSLVGVDILSIAFNGGELFKGIHYTKNIEDPDIVYINSTSLPPNYLVLLQTGDGSVNGDSAVLVTTGYYNANGDGATTDFTISHDIVGAYSIDVQPLTPDAAEKHWVFDATSHEAAIRFAIAPPIGVFNVSFSWIIVKLPTS